VEGYYNEYLVGKTGLIEGIKDQAGNVILRDDLKTDLGEEGTYLQLTLDLDIQKLVEDKLKNSVNNLKAKGGTAIVMDPSTGEILAMANYPTYDPSKYYEGEVIDCSVARYKDYKTCTEANDTNYNNLDQSQKDAISKQENVEKNIPGIFTNPGLSETREPGSIMKIVTVSAAINENKVSAQTILPSHSGCIMITDRKVCTANQVSSPPPGHTVEKMIEKSDNIDAFHVATTIGANTLYKYLIGFGVGKEARVGLDGESFYPLKDPEQWDEVDLATAAFGQGVISNNSLQNISAIATVANKGKRVQPHIIKTFVSNDKVVDFKPQVVSTPITESTAKQVVDIMKQATFGGYSQTAIKDILKNYTLAGKTGTAQIPDGKGGYIPNIYNNTYVAFAPADNPKFIMLVTIREPQGETYAGFSALPAWADIARDLIPYMGIEPDRK
jgi:cell division protein FtsI/penicillin-binding protein 2